MNNPNSQSQNPNILNQNPNVNNFLAEYLKNNPNPMIQQANPNNASESTPIPNANLDHQAAQKQKDFLNNMLQNQMLTNIFSSNAPLINGINGQMRTPNTNPLEMRKASVDEKAENKAPIGGECGAAQGPPQSFADFAQFAQAQNYALQFQNSQILLNEKQIFSGSFAANSALTRRGNEVLNNASDGNNALESIAAGQSHESNFNNLSNINNNNVNNQNPNEEACKNNCANPVNASGQEENEKKENAPNASVSNGNFNAFSAQGDFPYANAEANNSNMNVNNMNNLNSSANQKQFNFPFNANMHLNPNSNFTKTSLNYQEVIAAAAQGNNQLNIIEICLK